MNEEDEELYADVLLDKRLTAVTKLVAYVLLRDGVRRTGLVIRRSDIAVALAVNHMAVCDAFESLQDCKYIDAAKTKLQGIWRVKWIYE